MHLYAPSICNSHSLFGDTKNYSFYCSQRRSSRAGYRRMQTYRVTPAFAEDGSRGRRLFSSYLQTPTKFIGEIHVILSAALIVTFGIIITIYATLAEPTSQDIANYRLGVMCFMSVCLVGCFLDLGLAFLLIHSAKEMSRTKCIFWWRCTFISAILSCMLSTCFAVLVGSSLILLAVLPNAAFKPFGLYVVGGFLGDISRTKARILGTRLQLQHDNADEDWVDSSTTQPRQRPPTASSSDSMQSRRGKTVFVYTDTTDGADRDVASHGDTDTDTTPLPTATVVEEILQEKFHFLSKPSHTATTRTKSKRVFPEKDQENNQN